MLHVKIECDHCIAQMSLGAETMADLEHELEFDLDGWHHDEDSDEDTCPSCLKS